MNGGLQLETLSVYTFRSLSDTTKKYISIERVMWMLWHKLQYLSSLTYQQKCKVDTARVVEVVQKRMQKQGMYVAKSLIRLIFKAEEECYMQFEEDETLEAA